MWKSKARAEAQIVESLLACVVGGKLGGNTPFSRTGRKMSGQRLMSAEKKKKPVVLNWMWRWCLSGGALASVVTIANDGSAQNWMIREAKWMHPLVLFFLRNRLVSFATAAMYCVFGFLFFSNSFPLRLSWLCKVECVSIVEQTSEVPMCGSKAETMVNREKHNKTRSRETWRETQPPTAIQKNT